MKMANKFYDKVKEYIKYNLSFLIFLILFLGAFSIETDYSIYKPGGSIDITNRINNVNKDTYKSKGSINMAYVGMVKGKLPFYLLAKILPSWELVKNEDITYSDDETIKDSLKRDHLYYEESISNAKYIAYQKSGVKFDLKKTTNYIIYVDKKCDAEIKIGDEIIKYDNISYTDLNTLKSYIQTKNIGDKLSLVIKRAGKEIQTIATIFEEENLKLIGLAAITIHDIDSKTNIKVDSKASESGPSGGLMLSLAIYDALTKEDITKGNKIVGTGTISLDGSVGGIGGVKYKLAGAVKDHADIFIVPKDNLKETLEYSKKKGYNIKIIGVSTFDETLEVLKNMEEK